VQLACGFLGADHGMQWLAGRAVSPEGPLDGIWLRLTGTEAGTCRLTCTPSAIEAGVCTPAIPSRSPAVVDGVSMAYLTIRRRAADDANEARWELGAIGHGPSRDQFADRLCHHRLPGPS
jgi:protein-L-isoaspartate(D-aspartate) O-methyltransferase